MIIAVGVNSNPSTPSGPLRDRIRNTIRPTTTGGSPMKVLSRSETRPRPGKPEQRHGCPEWETDQAGNRDSAEADP